MKIIIDNLCSDVLLARENLQTYNCIFYDLILPGAVKFKHSLKKTTA